LFEKPLSPYIGEREWSVLKVLSRQIFSFQPLWSSSCNWVSERYRSGWHCCWGSTQRLYYSCRRPFYMGKGKIWTPWAWR